MRPQVHAVTSVDTSPALRVNYREQDFKVGIGVAVQGTLTYSVQHTYDDPANFTSNDNWNSTGVWHDNADLAGATATGDTSYLAPVQGVRLNVTAFTSGAATITVLQAT